MPLQLNDFQGRWDITREIHDHLTARVGHLSGVAEFTPDPNGLLYREAGVLRFADQTDLSASQTYLWQGAGAQVSVQFSDARPFHEIDLNTVQPEAHHHCPPDDYRVRYDFSHWPQWFCHWRVKGPRKDYDMWTRYAAL